MKLKSLLLGALALFMINAASGRDITQFVVGKFSAFYQRGIDEKLYLQTDKPYYSAGEQIWFKGFLVNAITHMPLEFTNHIYVELTNSKGELVERVNVKKGAGGFSGYINTVFDLPAGGYTLRAYTKWMMNNSEDLFFTKNIEIVTPIPPSLEEGEAEGGESKAQQRAQQKAQKAAEERAAKKLEYELQFFPEGGVLVSGVMQTMAFKSLAEDGLSIEAKGTIYDSTDKEITTFETTHKGMGAILFSAVAGQKYYAKVESSQGYEKRFELPAVEAQAASLQIARMNNKLFYKVNTNDPAIIAGAYVVIHSRGKIIAIDGGNLSVTRSVSENQLASGISVVTLVGANDQVISERILFKRPIAEPKIKIKTDAPNYPKRKRALVTAEVVDGFGDPVVGEFGVSVIDNKSVTIDPLRGDIYSYMLLDSELVGHIEDPGYYFFYNTPEVDRNLDILMLTQGWRRFDLAQVLSEQGVEQGPNLYEKNQVINGEVKGFFGNAARSPNIFVLCSALNYVDMFQMDRNNDKFSLVVNIPDSAIYIVQAQGKNGGKSMTLGITEEVFPEPKAGYYLRIDPEQEDATVGNVPFAFINQSQQKFYYEGGTAMLSLDAVFIDAGPTDDEAEADFASTQSMSKADLDEMTGMTLDQLLQTIAGIKMENNAEEGTMEVYYRNNTEPMKFIVDGVDNEYEFVNSLTADQIERIDLYDSVDAVMFSDAPGGVIQVTLRQSASLSVDKGNIAYVTRLGYQRTATFYQPSYDSPSTVRNAPPDFRTTIYWNGELKSDAKGVILFDFFTADNPTDYSIIIEGMTIEGEICRGETTIKRTLSN